MDAESASAITVEHLSKVFRLPYEKQSSIKSTIINLGQRNKGYEKQQALKDINLDIKAGEFFGIIGRNGSGKSTLLKILAGIYAPTEGKVKVNGKLTPFIELGVGFNPELTGRENVFLNGALLGFNRREMNEMYDDIVEFAELERFMDQKLKNYSSGMQVRLAFSIAIRADSDILLIDEVLAVGDTNFQKKCFDVFADFKRQKKTIILVTHDMSSVEEYCNRAMLINQGDVVAIGEANEVTKQYNELNTEATIATSNLKGFKDDTADGDKRLQIVGFSMGDAKGHKYVFKPEDKISLQLRARANQQTDDVIAGITIYDQLNHPIFATNTKAMKVKIENYNAGDEFEVEFTLDNVMSDGTYYVQPTLAGKEGRVVYDSLEQPVQFKTAGWSYPAYLLQPKHQIQVKSVGVKEKNV